MRVAVVGAGISGLAAAYDLQKHPNISVTLLERDAIPGGKIRTVRESGYLVELGAESIFSAKPWSAELVREVGLADELMEPCTTGFCILNGGKLQLVPKALARMVPAASESDSVDFLTSEEKQRAAGESSVSPGTGEDESVASFFRRRFGLAYSKLVAEPVLAGTHAGDPEKLSMAALYPAYVRMEQSHGSIAAAASASSPSPSPGFLALRSGMGTFPARLLHALRRVDWMPSTEVMELKGSGDSITLVTSAGELSFNHVILTLPAYASAPLAEGYSKRAAEILRSIRFISTATVTLAYDLAAIPETLFGTGFLVPYDEPSKLTGCTWSSNKWPDRAPSDKLLLRAFLGRDGGLNVDDATDEDLISIAVEEMRATLKPSSGPVYRRLDRWPKGMPQYELGHLDRLSELDAELAGSPISVIGSSYRGNSISDCVRQGREAASALVHLSTPPS